HYKWQDRHEYTESKNIYKSEKVCRNEFFIHRAKIALFGCHGKSKTQQND
ncbi:MAG: hypothetical protein ACJA0U_003274, partial [Salibacteraceae bacterium]